MSLLPELEQLLTRAKRRHLLQRHIQLLPWLVAVLMVFGWWGVSAPGLAVTALALVVFSLPAHLWSAAYGQITPMAILLHLNRTTPELDESAQLLLADDAALNLLQKLQKDRVSTQLSTLFRGKGESLLPTLQWHRPVLHLAFIVAAFALLLLSTRWEAVESQVRTLEGESVPAAEQAIDVISREVSIVAPEYTGAAEQRTSDFNISAISGSQITWTVSLSNTADTVTLQFGDGRQYPLENLDDNTYRVQLTPAQTQLYFFVVNGTRLPDLYTLTLTRDQLPRVKIIEPKSTVTELPKQGVPTLMTRVAVSDDFGVGRVNIQASVAKGSGEAVKFRDQLFLFDYKKPGDTGMEYVKGWDLRKLGMEPGDEMYFTVQAWDNREPEPQLTRSRTRIVRWVEDEGESIVSEGVLIDFIPEYFKSQRQIIIETEELIQDRSQLREDLFNETSRGLGFAQSDLKQKYGQYLGDEFAEGVADFTPAEAEGDGGGAQNVHTHDDDGGKALVPWASSGHVHSNSEVDNKDKALAAGHSHGDTSLTASEDKTGYRQLVDAFGHNHGEADIGFIAKKSPKTLMKLAVGEMWQAELHLMLSEPEQALPFEKQALIYLNRAKKAERIYTKRLGFEPPPVSENRRYQGELTDIKGQHRIQTESLPEQDHRVIAALLTQISQRRWGTALSESERRRIAQVKSIFTEQLQQRPALIGFVSTLDKIQQADSYALPDCLDCVASLVGKLWQLLPAPTALPASSRESYFDQQDAVKAYGDYLSKGEPGK